MIPISYDEGKAIIDKGNVCGVCGGELTLCWGAHFGIEGYALRCGINPRHEGIARPFAISPSNDPDMVKLYHSGKRRREEMEKEYGTEQIKAIAKYEGVVSLTRIQAGEILEAIWPEAPKSEKLRAALLCASYGLNPLMKHIFLIPFNKGKPSESWATVMGINATRLLGARRGPFSYINGTPRVMTKEEQAATFGEYDTSKIWVVCKLKDPSTNADAVGYGWWPRNTEAYGIEKGNTKFNMAAIRAERQALSRLRPGEMPVGIEVMDEAVAESASKEGFIIEGEAREIKEPSFSSPDKGDEAKKKIPIDSDLSYKAMRPKIWGLNQRGVDGWESQSAILKRLAEAGADISSADVKAAYESLNPEQRQRLAEIIKGKQA